MTDPFRSLLSAAGWEPDTHGGMVHPGGDFRIDLSGDFSQWALERFDDSDNSDGVAQARWISAKAGGTEVMGDTAEELARLLPYVGGQIPAEWADAPGWSAEEQADRERQCRIEEAAA